MEEVIKNLQDRVTELQTACNTVRRVVVSPNIPISLFINGPAGEDALALPKGKVTEILVNLIGAKEAVLHLNVIQPESNITEEIRIKLGQVIVARTILINEWSIIRAKISTEEQYAFVVIGFIFQPASSYVAEKGVENAGVSTQS